MSLPTFVVNVDFVDPPTNTLAGNDVNLSDHLTQMSIRRGRNTEQDAAQTGTCLLTLLDDDRRFDPTNASGPYYPNVLPGKRVEVHAVLDSVTYPVFFGYIDPQNCWQRDESSPAFAEVTTQVNDGFDRLNISSVYDAWNSPGATPGHDFVSELTGNRVQNVLLKAGLTIIFAYLHDGNEMMQASAKVDNAGSTALSLIRDAELTEPGYFYFRNDGYPAFQSRRDRLAGASVATFCDKANFSTGRVLYDVLTTRRTPLINDVRVDASGFTEQVAIDNSSVTNFFTRFASYATKHVSAAAALLAAQFRLSQTKDSYEVFDTLTLTPGTDSAAWAQVLGREIGDLITVIRTPPGGGAVVTRQCFIESVSLDWGPGPDATCVWRLSNADQTSYWLAGTVGASEAGTTTRAGY